MEVVQGDDRSHRNQRVGRTAGGNACRVFESFEAPDIQCRPYSIDKPRVCATEAKKE
jgi:hypothetical protein